MQTPEKYHHSPPPDTILAQIRGNKLLPQTNAGIAYFMLDTVLSTCKTPDAFLAYITTPEQDADITALQTTTNNEHARRGLRFIAKSDLTEFAHVNRINVVTYTNLFIDQVVHHAQKSIFFLGEPNYSNPAALQNITRASEFLFDPKYTHEVQAFRSMTTVAANTLREPACQTLARCYQDLFDKKDPQKAVAAITTLRTLVSSNTLVPPYGDLAAMFEDKDATYMPLLFTVREAILIDIASLVTDRVREVVLDEKAKPQSERAALLPHAAQAFVAPFFVHPE